MSRAHWPGTSLYLPTFGQWRGFRENNTTINQKKEGDKGNELSCGLDGALFRQVAGLAAVIAVDFICFAALHSNMTDLTAPVALDFITAFLDVTETSTGVALLFIGMWTFTCQMACLATVVADWLPLLLGLLAVPRDVATPTTVVACVFSQFTVPGDVAWYSTAIAEEIFSSTTALGTPTSRTILNPMARAATTIAIVATHRTNQQVNT